jgi:hypothetical protein
MAPMQIATAPNASVAGVQPKMGREQAHRDRRHAKEQVSDHENRRQNLRLRILLPRRNRGKFPGGGGVKSAKM